MMRPWSRSTIGPWSNAPMRADRVPVGARAAGRFRSGAPSVRQSMAVLFALGTKLTLGLQRYGLLRGVNICVHAGE
jgi:hypothetical protein